MSRFVECVSGVLVNTDVISRVEQGLEKGEDCTVVLKDGTYFKAPYYVYEYIEGKNYITQLIPVHDKYETVYSNDTEENNGEPYAWDCEYLAVCANGEVRSVGSGEGYIDFEDDSCNYMGLRMKQASEVK